MLQPIITHEDDRTAYIGDQVRFTDRLTDVFRCRMQQLEDIHRWLAGYFQAVGILLQIPGAADYHHQDYASDDDLWDLIWNPDPDSTLNVLAATLERLDADELLAQVPGGDGFKRRPLPVEARVHLAERDRLGLLNVVADCLDRLLVAPHIPGEAEARGLTTEDDPQPTDRTKPAQSRAPRRTRPARQSDVRRSKGQIR
ncbi:MAG: hypothetical protein PVJ57_19740 [Phycisphaerae bacterium]|jgi:hypothetical protein